MAEKSDEEIVNEESGLESKITDEEVLAHLSLNNDDEKDTLKPVENKKSTNNDNEKNNPDVVNNKDTKEVKQDIIENEDKDYEKELENDGSNGEEEELVIQKRQPKIFRILMGIAGLLFIVLILGLILYFVGFFDPEEEKVKAVTKVEVKKVVPDIVFDEKEIDKKELNKKLTMLTKKDIMTKEELEAEEKKIAEEKRKKEEAEKKALEEKKKQEELKLANQLAKIKEEKDQLIKHQEEIKKQQEEFIKLQEEAKKEIEEKMQNLNSGNIVNVPKREIPTNKENINNEEMVKPVVEDKVENDNFKTFLSFINVATIKGDLYKSYLDKVEKYDKNLSLCRDLKNRIEIYFGPYSSQKEREKVYNSLIENGFKQAYLVDFTEEEYKKRCEY